jgi:transcriptional regulator with XRE-family HTH domain
MAIADMTGTDAVPTPLISKNNRANDEPNALHRIRTVRLQQGVSLRSAARQMGSDIRSLRLQEQESTDLRLSDLHKWQKALDVPLTDLVEETDEPLSRPVMERARLIRLMKTAKAIEERSPTASVSRMAETLVSQLVEIMPELKDVSPWHQFGQRRSLEELGRVVERRMSDDLIPDNLDDD